MQTETVTRGDVLAAVENHNLKTQLLAALQDFIRKRPRLDPGAYRGAGDAYRRDSRRIGRDLRDAETLLCRVELSPIITGRDMVEASRGRRLELNTGPEGVRVDYTPGQSFSNEYRAAVADFAATLLRDFIREHVMPPPVYGVEWKNERGEWVDAGKSFDNSIMAEMYATEVRETRQRESRAFETVPHGYGDTLIVEKYRAAGLSRAVSGGEWLARHFRREYGRGMSSRWFE